MPDPSYTNELTGYFDHSLRFYYIVTDLQGSICYANPLFNELTAESGAAPVKSNLIDYFLEDDRDRFSIARTQCLQEPGTAVLTDLRIKWKGDSQRSIRWELMARPGKDRSAEGIQAIGYMAILITHDQDILSLQERYSAFEYSAEGLWMFETPEPVAVTDPPEKIVEYWRTHSYLAECNENMARMYGYEKAEDLKGTVLGNLLDFNDRARIENLVHFIRSGFHSKNVETREFDRYGNVKYFLNSMSGMIVNGTVKRVWGTQQDITEQRKAEGQLRESELFYRSLIADSLDGILLTDEKAIISFVSPSVTKILGYEAEEILGHTAFEYAHPEDRELGIATFRDEVRGTPRVKFISIRLRRKNGEWRWCIVRGHNLINNPNVGRMVIYFADDSLRKKAEEALIESGNRLRTQAIILNNVTDVIVTTDLNRVVTSWNKVMEKLSGIAEAEAIGKLYRNVLDTDYSPYTHEQVADIVFKEGIWRGEVSFTGGDGEKRYLLHTVSILQNEKGESIGLLGVGKDISERKKMEARLQQSESFYRNLAAHSLDGIIMTNEKGEINYCGPSVFKITGFELHQLLGHSIFEFVHPDDTGLAMESFLTNMASELVGDYIVVRLRHAIRGWFWCTVRGLSLLHDRSVNAIVIYFTDDTKRKEIEDRLRESEKKFRTLIFNLTQGVVLLNEEGRVILFNPASLKILDVGEDQMMGTTSLDPQWNAIHEDGTDFPGSEHPIQQAMKTRKPVRDVVMGVYRHRTRDRVWLLVNADPMLDEQGRLISLVCSFTDVTEQRKLTQQLLEQEMQRQRLLTQATIDGQERERQEIGKELHDNINQHLNTTRLYLEVAREKATGEVLEMIRLAHSNLAAIVNEIRQLSQSLVPPTLGDLGLVESILELCDSLKRAHSFQVEFLHRHFREDELPENLKLMIFRIIQEQVSNIIRHAQAGSMQIKLQSDAEYIVLSISDDGKGFDLLNYKRGMGLNNISNRAGLFNGKVEIHSAPGKGCTVMVTIPRQVPAPA